MNTARIVLFLALSSFATAADLTPQLGSLGEKLLEETFTSTELPKGWASNTGTLALPTRTMPGYCLASR